ncbi:serine/threonine protein kinase [Mycobacterium terramassiliense]|uniref:non-specific serine/threonine protein kinase n=1 Tax=Mycobacterium terramassiliense TaxID=1841859 RepID=A0A2U3NIP8_9MYCO|nr:serine/threonine-protein kinase PknH/PknJ [Mycobacterium terramassiliense]SPM31305.1 serine/threonine protein kinase [Mycobacterium terramassiliense]
MSDAQASRVGSMFGPYHLKRLLGRGGMGEVYEAEHTVKEWTVAVKLMSDTFSKDPVFRERMKREARIAGRLQEPHVVPIHDYGEIDGQMYMEMRLIEGTDLDSVLKRFGPLTPPRAVAIITQIASALDAAHAAGVMHRDVKPPNILVTRDDFAYLVDFGIASATTDEKLTQLGTAVGTWKYMAPERFSNDEVTYRADIYALACVLHEALTGSPPYRADSASTLVTAHLMDPIPKPSAVRPGVPKAFDAVIARGMAKKPEDRYASAGDLALAAHEALSDPDQDHANKIVRRSQEATLPATAEAHTADSGGGQGGLLAATHDLGSPPPYSTAPSSGPLPQAAPTQRPWAPDSAPVPSGPQAYPGGGGNWSGPPSQFTGPAPWNQPAPKPKRNPWPVVAAVVALVVLAGGGVGIWLLTRPAPAPPPPDPVPPGRLNALLLDPSGINTIMGSSSMTPGKPITSTDTSTVTLSLPNCLSSLYTSQDPVYAGTGYTGISGLVSSEPGDDYDHWVNQAAVAFPSAEKAKAFLQASADKWKACSGKTVTVTNKTKTFRWTFAQLNGAPPKITMLETQEGADGWECQRAMGVANNVVADVNACGYHISDQGGQVIDKILAKVENE